MTEEKEIKCTEPFPFPLFPNIKFICLMGENRVGKDTMAVKLKNEYKALKYNVQIISLADELKEIYMRDFDEERDMKSISIRRELYELSLKIKQVEGKSYFCRVLFSKIEKGTNIVIVPDLRFIEEYEYFKTNLKNLYVIRIFKKNLREEEKNEFLNSYDIEKIPYDKKIEISF